MSSHAPKEDDNAGQDDEDSAAGEDASGDSSSEASDEDEGEEEEEGGAQEEDVGGQLRAAPAAAAGGAGDETRWREVGLEGATQGELPAGAIEEPEAWVALDTAPGHGDDVDCETLFPRAGVDDLDMAEANAAAAVALAAAELERHSAKADAVQACEAADLLAPDAEETQFYEPGEPPGDVQSSPSAEDDRAGDAAAPMPDGEGVAGAGEEEKQNESDSESSSDSGSRDSTADYEEPAPDAASKASGATVGSDADLPEDSEDDLEEEVENCIASLGDGFMHCNKRRGGSVHVVWREATKHDREVHRGVRATNLEGEEEKYFIIRCQKASAKTGEFHATLPELPAGSSACKDCQAIL
jgi:hypothetical protein